MTLGAGGERRPITSAYVSQRSDVRLAHDDESLRLAAVSWSFRGGFPLSPHSGWHSSAAGLGPPSAVFIQRHGCGRCRPP